MNFIIYQAMALTKDKRLTRRAKWYFAIYILKSPKKRLTKSTSRNKNHERTVSRAHKENSSSGSSNKREKICNKPSFRYIRKKKKATRSISIIAWKVKRKWLYVFQLSKKKQGQTSENLSWWDCESYYCWKKTQEKKSHFKFFKTEKLKRFKHFSARRWGLHQISHDAFQLYTLIMEKNI